MHSYRRLMELHGHFVRVEDLDHITPAAEAPQPPATGTPSRDGGTTAICAPPTGALRMLECFVLSPFR